jgi:hypothetical protein
MNSSRKNISRSGTELIIFLTVAKKLGEKLALFFHTFCKKFDHNIDF